MATGTVSSISGDNWQLINTVTPTGTATATAVSGLTGYKRLMLVWKTMVTASSTVMTVTLNASSSGYSGGCNVPEYNGQRASSTNELYVSLINATTHNGYLYIDNVLEITPKIMYGTADTGGERAVSSGAWLNSDAVTSIELKAGGVNFTGGTIYVYGIAA